MISFSRNFIPGFPFLGWLIRFFLYHIFQNLEILKILITHKVYYKVETVIDKFLHGYLLDFCLLSDERLAFTINLEEQASYKIAILNLKTKDKTELKNFKDFIRSICTNNNKLISGSNKEIGIWDPDKQECLITLIENNTIKFICPLLNNKIASATHYDNTIKIWDTKTGKIYNFLKGHIDSISYICQISDNIIASASSDHTPKIWNINTGKCLQTLNAHTDTIIYIFKLTNNRLVSISTGDGIIIWNLSDLYNPNIIKKLYSNSNEYYTESACLLKNEKIVTIRPTGKVDIWNINTGIRNALDKLDSNIDWKARLYQLSNDQDIIIAASRNDIKMININQTYNRSLTKLKII